MEIVLTTASDEDGTDLRLLMEFDKPYPVLDHALCTACLRSGDRTARRNCTVTLHHWDGMPYGFLFTRCPDHERFRAA